MGNFSEQLWGDSPERRHVERIEVGLRRCIYLERGYGERFGVPDGQLASYVAGFRSREQLLVDCDVILLPKPLVGADNRVTAADLVFPGARGVVKLGIWLRELARLRHFRCP